MSGKIWLVRLISLALIAGALRGGVDKNIQNLYIQNYKNRALYLKVPVHGLKQRIDVTGNGPVLNLSNAGEPLAFKVGDQIRITDIDFKDDFIRFKIAAIDFTRESELIFQFPEKLLDAFPNQGAFDDALEFALTRGLSYKEIDSAKETFIEGQFDRLIEQFATTTGTSTDYVIKTISEKNPEYKRLQQSLQQVKGDLENLRAELGNEQGIRREAESQAARMRREFEDRDARIRTLTVENSNLIDERDKTQRQVRQLAGELESLKKQQKGYEEQVAQLMRNLDVQTSSNTELGQQVTSLGRVVSSLKTENRELSEKLEAGSRQIDQLQQEKKQLSTSLGKLETENEKLSANLRVLTSDKKSINAAYVAMKEEKEILETARTLANGLTLKDEHIEAGKRLSDLYLLSAKVGILEVEIPEQTGQQYRVRLVLESPDTVKYSEEERRLSNALGEELTVEAQWKSNSSDLQIRLSEGEAKQSIGPRESAEWTWTFQGNPDRPSLVAFSLQVTDSNQQIVQLPTQEYTIRPAGLGGLVARSFSIWVLGLAFLIGAGLTMLGFFVRGGERKSPPAARRSEYVTEKRL